MNELKNRIIDISFRHKLSHLSSNLTAVDIIDRIYKKKKQEDIFVLSQGHAGLALYTVLEKHTGVSAEDYLTWCGIHPTRIVSIACSTGSLGHGLPIAVGMAIANRKRKVYCLISDGECDEGSIWESFRIIEEQKIKNIKIYLNYNGTSAYRDIKSNLLRRLPKFVKVVHTKIKDGPLAGVKGHYKVITQDEKNLLLQSLR